LNIRALLWYKHLIGRYLSALFFRIIERKIPGMGGYMIHGTTQDFFNATDYFVDRNVRQGRGHKVAVYTEFRNYTYNNIQKMTNKTANALRELGVRVDDRVMVLMLDVPQFYAVFWGIIKIGAVPIPVNTMLTPEDYEYYLNDSRARVLIVSEQLIQIITQIKGDLLYLRDLVVISETEGPISRSGKSTGMRQQNSKPNSQQKTTSVSGSTVPAQLVHQRAPSIPSMTW
jgi:acyl-CoA synthetase (AMP-forming)/AMP-acid ligase II